MGDLKKKCCDLSALHVNLLEEILAWLPMDSVCRFRSLSKEWNALLSRGFITDKWVKKPPNKDPWLVALQVGGSVKGVENGWIAVHDAGSLTSCFFNQTWKETSSVSLSFLQQHPEENNYSVDSICYGCYGSAAGLFLLPMTRHTGMQSTLVVANPLTRKSVELPVLSSDFLLILSAGIMSDSGDSYKVVVMSITPKQSLSLQVQIYDSTDKSWRIAGHLPENLRSVGNKLVFCSGYFYCLAITSGQQIVVGYNIPEGTSVFMPLPKIAGGLDMEPHLLTCGSRVLVAVLIWRNSELLLEIIIRELEKVKVDSSSSSSWWKEIARMPPSHLERFSRNGNNCINYCVGVGDSICFMVLDEQSKVKAEILAYSVTENTWNWLPNRPLDTTASTWHGREIPMAFEPRPDMKVD